MNKILKFVSTVILALLAIGFILFVINILCDIANAERKVSLSPDRTLTVREITISHIDSVCHVPIGLSAEQADSLVTGKLEKVTLQDSTGETTSSFALPFIKSETTYRNKEVLYHNGWITQCAPPFTMIYGNYILSLFWLWLPVILIAVVSIVNTVERISVKKLIVFYAAIPAGIVLGVLASVLLGMFIPTTSDESSNSVIGLFAGALIGAVAGGYANDLSSKGKWGGLGLAAGAVAGGLTGFIAGIFADIQNYEIVVNYGLFLLGVETFFFIIRICFFAYAERQRMKMEMEEEIKSGEFQ